jgi:hypothetical protein
MAPNFDWYQDVWEWNGSTWKQLAILPRSKRALPGDAYDASRGILYSIGGSYLNNGPSTATSEIWELRLHNGPIGPGEPTWSQPLIAEQPAYLGGQLVLSFPNPRGSAQLAIAPGLGIQPPLIVQGPGFCTPLSLYPDLTRAIWLPVATNPARVQFAIPPLSALQDLSLSLQAVTLQPQNCITATNGLAVILRGR